MRREVQDQGATAPCTRQSSCRRRSRILLVALMPVAAVAVLAACDASAAPGSSIAQAGLPTREAPPRARLFSMSGVLAVDDEGCVLFDTGEDNRGTVTPIWPDDFVTQGSGDTLTISSADGDQVAKIGGRITLAGGFPSGGYEEVACGSSSDAPPFEVDQIVAAPAT